MSLVTEVLPLCGVLTFCKATESLGFNNCISGLWTCALSAGGPLCAVVLMQNAYVAIGEFFWWVTVAVVVSSEALSKGVVVLKDIDCPGFSD